MPALGRMQSVYYNLFGTFLLTSSRHMVLSVHHRQTVIRLRVVWDQPRKDALISGIAPCMVTLRRETAND